MKKQAYFAGGCFWCMQPAFDRTPGVLRTAVGFTGGSSVNPSYEQVCTGNTGHFEAIEVEYDPAVVYFGDLIDVFWRNIDPTQVDGQFADRGSHYRTAIFYNDAEEQELAEASVRELDESGKFAAPIATMILPAKPFYPADDYHQRYYQKSAAHYESYKHGSGRAGFIQKNWGQKNWGK